ncbi:MAG TPA: glycoside hydrolase family 92 protein, partial [Actinomycetota bacterium]|nr:glycoside hydrolase family 92 protein [Actinomycetota bacterium]
GYVSFDATSDRDVLVKVGVSFVSRDNALANLDEEKPDWDFDALRAATRAEWADALATIDVDGGTELEKTSFYTALYHAQQHPNVFEDSNGEYMGHDGRVHTSDGYTKYANFSLWDTYRGENQLLATIQPARYSDMMRSLLDIHEEAGRFPQWAMNNALPDYMVGDPVQMTIVDGYCRGLLDDPAASYEALRHQATEIRRQWNADYLDKGWVGDGPSETLEYALADFALALMADRLGRTVDRDELLERAKNYLNVIDPSSGFARPRMGDGTWKSPYSPEEPDHFVEGTGWQYTWLAPQDLRGLFDAIGAGRGGDELVRERLDTFFSTPVAENVPAVVPEAQKMMTLFGIFYAGNQYAPSNEHDLHAPYLYDYAGQPWKTQGIMRGYQALFRATPDGLPGNDDLGSMSAWFVWSALGFYPVTGGAPVLAVGSPLFERAAIRPVGGGDPVTVEAPGASQVNRYIDSATLGDAPLERPWFTHDELSRAGVVNFAMAPEANQSWGSAPEAAPPSLSSHPLESFGCAPPEELQATALTYTGDTRARGESVDLAARLTTDRGEPLAGRTVVFDIAGQELAAVTGGDGVASLVATVADHGASQQVTVTFAGDASYLPSDTSAVVAWGNR